MADAIRFFTYIRKLYLALGIYPPDPNKNCSYNWRNLFVFLFLTILFIISTSFFIFKADSIASFGESFYVSTTSFMFLFLWSVIIHKMDDLYILMRKIDEFIAKSK